jgi:hypothetical protein
MPVSGIRNDWPDKVTPAPRLKPAGTAVELAVAEAPARKLAARLKPLGNPQPQRDQAVGGGEALAQAGEERPALGDPRRAADHRHRAGRRARIRRDLDGPVRKPATEVAVGQELVDDVEVTCPNRSGRCEQQQ